MIDGTTLLLVVTLLGLGGYNWYLHSIIQDLNEQIDNFMEMIMEMAKELQALGSPNVKVLDEENKA